MIEVNNLTTNRIDKDFFKKITEKVLAGEKKKEMNLSIVLVGQERIKELNKKYRRKNRITDALAFSEGPRSSPAFSGTLRGRQEFPVVPESELGLGEVVICLREVKNNAKRYNLTFEGELARVLIHGILHLLGYDHGKGEKEAKKMREKEDYYLRKIYGQE